jgi:hypothetical protein
MTYQLRTLQGKPFEALYVYWQRPKYEVHHHVGGHQNVHVRPPRRHAFRAGIRRYLKTPFSISKIFSKYAAMPSDKRRQLHVLPLSRPYVGVNVYLSLQALCSVILRRVQVHWYSGKLWTAGMGSWVTRIRTELGVRPRDLLQLNIREIVYQCRAFFGTCRNSSQTE